MRHQQLGDLFGASGVLVGQSQVAEVLVAPHEVGRVALQDRQERFQAPAVEGLLEVLNDVELDAPLPQ